MDSSGVDGFLDPRLPGVPVALMEPGLSLLFLWGVWSPYSIGERQSGIDTVFYPKS